MSIFYRCFEGRQINFAKSAFINEDLHIRAIFFLVITDKMFGAGPYPLSLNPLDEGRNQLGSQVRIFTGHVLEISPTHRHTIKIHARAKYGKVTPRSRVKAPGHSLLPGQATSSGSSQ